MYIHTQYFLDIPTNIGKKEIMTFKIRMLFHKSIESTVLVKVVYDIDPVTLQFYWIYVLTTRYIQCRMYVLPK